MSRENLTAPKPCRPTIRPTGATPGGLVGGLGLVLLLAALGLLTSCAILSPPPPRTGGDRLSDAVKETQKQPADQSTLEGGERVDCGLGTEVEVALGELGVPAWDQAGEPVESSHRNLFEHWYLGMVAGAGSVGSGDFALYGLRAGCRPAPRTSFDLALLGGPSRFAAGGAVAAALRDPMELKADFSLRYSLTPEHASMAIAPLGGVQLGVLSWRYLNGLEVAVDGEVRDVSGDGIYHVSPYAGLAVTLVRTPHFEIGGLGLVGWRFYGRHTTVGLQNDLFGDTRFAEFRLETTFPF